MTRTSRGERQADETERLAVLIPCRDGEKTNGTVVAAVTEVLPEATIYFDNASKDSRAERLQLPVRLSSECRGPVRATW